MNSKTYDVYDKLNPPVEEAYRVLRTNILFCNSERKIKSLAIVSCNPRDGKTSVAINLAISIARAGLKILMVDADLRKPERIKRLGNKNPAGLSSYLGGYAEIEDILCNTSIENLSYISCGPRTPNPSELISSVGFTKFLHDAEERFDMVIVDTTTLGSVIDSAIIASQTDGTLLVVASGLVKKRKAQRVKEQLENTNANILGVVLNKVSKGDYKLYNSYYDEITYYMEREKTHKGTEKKNNNSNNNSVPQVV